jgi:hypothetical protein
MDAGTTTVGRKDFYSKRGDTLRDIPSGSGRLGEVS